MPSDLGRPKTPVPVDSVRELLNYQLGHEQGLS